MVTNPVSGIRHEAQQLNYLQIDTLRLESSLTSSELCEYHSRSRGFTALHKELDQIRQRPYQVRIENTFLNTLDLEGVKSPSTV